MQLTVESVKNNKGKSLIVVAGGKDYFAKKDAGIQQGMTIEATTEDSAYNGKTYTWIQSWSPVAGAPTPAPAAAAKPNGSSGSVGGSPVWLPMASNAVAHAIAAGLIKDPK